MRVRIYDIDQDTGAETFRETAELVACFGDGTRDPDYLVVIGELALGGRAVIGGGASPMVALIHTLDELIAALDGRDEIEIADL